MNIQRAIARALAIAFVKLGGESIFHFFSSDGLAIGDKEEVIVTCEWKFRRETLTKVPVYKSQTETKFFDK